MGDSAPQVVGSLSPVNEFAAPVRQEQLVAEETTQNPVGIRTQVQQFLFMLERIESAVWPARRPSVLFLLWIRVCCLPHEPSLETSKSHLHPSQEHAAEPVPDRKQR